MSEHRSYGNFHPCLYLLNNVWFKQKDTDNDHQTSKPKASKDAQLFQVEKDEQNGEDEFKNRNLKELAKRFSKKDSSDKFGTLLFAKAEVKPFFITTDDERLKEQTKLRNIYSKRGRL